MAKPTVILPASRESAERFKVLAAQGPAGVKSAAKAAGLKFETMPERSRAAVPENAIYHKESWWFEEYRGTPENLIAIGVMEPHMKPAKIGRKVSIPATGKQDPARRAIVWSTSRIFAVLVYVPEEIVEQRRNAYFEEIDRERKQEARAISDSVLEEIRARRYQKDIDEMPKSAEQFRTEVSESVGLHLSTVKWLMSEHGNGYYYAEDVLCEVDRLACEIERLLSDGETGFDQAERDSKIQELRALGAKYNPQLQSLLTTAAAVDLVKHENKEAA